ncbi:hypothetical protein SKAU_G00114540 [Synaphobranchus kaupii]|uniref:Uncharacterized protein n=1 Tax=Synaphobranchus kaupii TaxID=118154 RepID=A0A9Q1FMH8_SYNKA|nr:hypothetical protein SKAU_G00114540 [Synaphobranchus kaupii]
MASLLEDKLFEVSGQGAAPNKDFYQFVITKTEVIWRFWKISLRSEFRKTRPGELKQSHEYYLHDSQLQHQVKVVFGEGTLLYSQGLCSGNFDYLPRLPDCLLLRILVFLELEEIQHLRCTSHKFQKLCDSEEFWEQAVRARCDTVTMEMGSLARELGWKKVFFTNKLQLQKQISRWRQKQENAGSADVIAVSRLAQRSRPREQEQEIRLVVRDDGSEQARGFTGLLLCVSLTQRLAPAQGNVTRRACAELSHGASVSSVYLSLPLCPRRELFTAPRGLEQEKQNRLHSTCFNRRFTDDPVHSSKMALLCQSSPMLADTTHSGVLLGALCDQRAKGLFCDVTIVVEDIKFRAHRNVLAASSGYFRNALASPDVWTSGQVLELMDLRSEVFARILNFIYSSKVALTTVEDVRSLVAAGKRLGIPFLERLLVSEMRTEQSIPQNPTSILNQTPAAPGSHRTRRKTSDSRRGPRITNAFSITDIATGNDPFTPLDLRGGGQRSMDSTAASCPTLDSAPSTCETLHTLADHSYAVNMGEGGGASAHSLAPPHTPETAANTHMPVHAETAANTHSPVQAKSAGQASQKCSPLKKRYKLWGNLDENTPGSPAQTPAQTPGRAHNVTALTSPSPDSSSPNQKTQLDPASDLPKTAETPPVVSGPPPALLPLKPSEVAQHHRPKAASTPKRRYLTRLPGLLFCRFCHRKFMHLKRLRNHELVCTKCPDPNDGEEEEDKVVRGPAFISGPAFAALPSGLSGPPAAEIPEMIWEVGTGAGMGVGMGGQLGRAPRRMYPCSVCKRAYATISSLRRHENVHSWQRAYPCHYCNKVFALAEYRTKHEVWHTGERRYQCIFCLETFMTYYILKNHQKSYHGIDPRLSVNRKSANGGFKGSVYPIKLYRLLPMKFRKRRYRSYGRAFSEAPEFGEQAFSAPLGSGSSPSAAFREGTDGPPVFSAPLTFMATQRMVAPVQPSHAEAEACLRRGGVSPPPSLFHGSTDGHGYTLPELQMHTRTSSPRIHDHELGDGCLPPDSTSGSGNDPEDRSPTAVHPPEDGGHIAAGGKIATYIAKPACPGPSSDSRVPPLCQITVKIGNEAIVRRSIAGSNLIPRKKRRHSLPHMEGSEVGGGDLIERAVKKQSLHPRPERTRKSLREAEPGDDGSFCDDVDEPWRPYYSYKSKRRAKRLRSRDRMGGRRARQRRSTDRELTLQGKAYNSEQNFPSDAGNVRIGVQRTTHSCEDCQRAFSSLSALRTHMADCHPKERVHNCRSCGKRRSLEEVQQDGKEFTCSACANEYSHLENSAGSPAPDRRYRCSFCPQRFLYLATRRSHERKHLEKHGKGQGCHYVPKPPSVGVHQKRHVIKTEEEEVEVQQVEEADSKAAAREELKLTVWDDHQLGSPVTLKLEDQTETNGGDCD